MTIPSIARDKISESFYDATARGELLLRSCAECGQVSQPEATQCPVCAHRPLSWTVAGGGGRVVSWSIPHGRDGAALMVSGLIELDEGCWMRARIVDTDPARLAAGLPVEVRFIRSGGDDDTSGEVVPVFTSAVDGTGHDVEEGRQ